jgi:hypothetical protein
VIPSEQRQILVSLLLLIFPEYPPKYDKNGLSSLYCSEGARWIDRLDRHFSLHHIVEIYRSAGRWSLNMMKYYLQDLRNRMIRKLITIKRIVQWLACKCDWCFPPQSVRRPTGCIEDSHTEFVKFPSFAMALCELETTLMTVLGRLKHSAKIRIPLVPPKQMDKYPLSYRTWKAQDDGHFPVFVIQARDTSEIDYRIVFSSQCGR